ncbi:MAG: AAA family ATPase [Pseudomonadota bacterium]
MIISSVKLLPFAGLSNTELKLRKGLNVILGDNETGKSTLVDAISCCLFLPARMTPHRLATDMGSYFPKGGGDTVRVEILFSADGKKYVLKKTWGSDGRSELGSEDGSALYTDDEAIDEQLAAFLVASPRTYETVMMTYQSKLEKTFNELKEDPDILRSLGDILRSAVFETDGVSIDRFKDRIDAQFEFCFGRWDADRGCPEKSRGIDNPWKVGTGRIVEAYYELEQARRACERAREVEDGIDELNRQIDRCLEQERDLHKFLSENEKAYEDAGKRKALQAELGLADRKLEECKEANTTWPVLEEKEKEFMSQLPQMEAKLEKLKAEKQEAAKFEAGRKLREKFGRAKTKKGVLDEMEAMLKETKKLSREDFGKLEETKGRLDDLKIRVTAGRLAVKFRAKKQIQVAVREGISEPFKIVIEQDKTREFEAGGMFRMEHADWDIEVQSGESDLDSVLKQMESAGAELEDLFKKHDEQSVETAKETSRKYEVSLRAVEGARRSLEEELEGAEYEEIQEKVKALGVVEPAKPLADLSGECATAEGEVKSKRKELEEVQEKAGKLKKKYDTMDNLLDKLTEAKKKRDDAKKELTRLAPLPEGVDDPEQFIKDYRKRDRELRDKERERHDLEKQKARIPVPEESSEELEKILEELEETFEAAKRKGAAVARIQEVAESIIEKLDVGTYKGLKEDLQMYVAAMTGNRYRQIAMDESLPTGLVRRDGVELEPDLLSVGTQDVLGLALRLSMANYFLRGSDGFLIMDDPLVDMDPSRRKKAARVLKAYAKAKQVIVFTCHPDHAKILGGPTAKL